MLRKDKILLALGTLVGTYIVAMVFYGYAKTQLPMRYTSVTAPVRVNDALSVMFSQDVSQALRADIEPAVAGTWTMIPGSFGVKGVRFRPDGPLETGKQYSVRLQGVRRSFTGVVLAEKKVIAFTTEAAAGVSSFGPADGATEVGVESIMQVKLAAANHGLRKLAVTTEPAVPMEALAGDDQTFRWKFQQPLAQGTAYKFFVDDLNMKDVGRRRLVSARFVTVVEPRVSGTERDYFAPGDKVTVTFDRAMKQTAGIFRFDMTGAGKWLSATQYEFAPTGLKPGTTYSYTVLKGAASLTGGVVAADRTFRVSTPGAVVVTGSSPGGSGVSRGTAVRFTFDQAVDRASAEARFGMNPSVSGSFSWSGNTMTFQPSGLDFQTTYTATVGAGVVPGFGLVSARAFATSFTTELQVTRLDVPYYRQPLAMSCELTSLRMALAYRGITASEMDLVIRAGYNPRPRDMAANVWDNPYEMFVGDINGVQNTTGYGVYAAPVAAAARSYGQNATAQSGVSVNFVAQQVLAGNPVIVWGYSSSPKLDSWNTSSGVVEAWKGEHARLVVGVVGRADAPAGFYVHDPLGGQNVYWSAGQLAANMNVFGNLSNQVVVVY